MIYLFITGILVFIIQEKRKGLYASLNLAIVFLIFQIIEANHQRNQQFITLYNIKGETAIAIVDGTDVTFISSLELWNNEQAMLFHVRHHWWNKGIESERFVELNDSLTNKQITVGEVSFGLLDLSEAARTVSFVSNESLDWVILNKLNWNGIEHLSSLPSNHVYLSNNLGGKTREKLLCSNHTFQIIDLSVSGSKTLDLN
jgi:hypothetical protein